MRRLSRAKPSGDGESSGARSIRGETMGLGSRVTKTGGASVGVVAGMPAGAELLMTISTQPSGAGVSCGEA